MTVTAGTQATTYVLVEYFSVIGMVADFFGYVDAHPSKGDHHYHDSDTDHILVFNTSHWPADSTKKLLEHLNASDLDAAMFIYQRYVPDRVPCIRRKLHVKACGMWNTSIPVTADRPNYENP